MIVFKVAAIYQKREVLYIINYIIYLKKLSYSVFLRLAVLFLPLYKAGCLLILCFV
jgi:hypothetical protein